MKASPLRSKTSTTGFTLIELLVVIAIIAVLAGLLLPTIAYAKTLTKKKITKMETLTLVAAIQQYAEEYKRMPASQEVEECAGANPGCPDFTYGTVDNNGNLMQPSYPSVSTYDAPTYKAFNAELLAILRGAKLAPTPNLATIAKARNPRNITFFEPKIAASANAHGLGPDGVLRDPWGNPYIISVDMNDDQLTLDGFYGDLRKGGPGLEPKVNVPVMVWSFGPDGKASPDPDLGANGGENKDNILSWD